MIGYVTIGTNNFERALAFYDELLASISIERLWKAGAMAAWGPSRQETALCGPNRTTRTRRQSATG